MHVGFDEARKHAAALRINHLGCRRSKTSDVGNGSNRDKAVAAQGKRLSMGMPSSMIRTRALVMMMSALSLIAVLRRFSRRQGAQQPDEGFEGRMVGNSIHARRTEVPLEGRYHGRDG